MFRLNISIFDVTGPVMIGPSSSHTAGAARLAYVAAAIAPDGFWQVKFGLAGSFAKTGRGHGTDKALLAGALGLSPDDTGIRDAYALAKARGISYDFETIELPDSHENSARITFLYEGGETFYVEGSSIGGGCILVTNLNGLAAEFSAESPTLITMQYDRQGVVSAITQLLAEQNINIGVMRVNRTARGDVASTVIETDAPVPETIVRALKSTPNIIRVCAVSV